MGYSPWVKKSQIQQSDSHTHTSSMGLAGLTGCLQ